MHAPGPHRSVGYLLAGILQRKVGKSDWQLGWCDVVQALVSDLDDGSHYRVTGAARCSSTSR
jgi:hypothetical protein